MEKVQGSPTLDLSKWVLNEKEISERDSKIATEAAETALQCALDEASINIEINKDEPLTVHLWVTFDETKPPIKYNIPIVWEIENNVIGAHHEDEDPGGLSEPMRRLAGRFRELAGKLERAASEPPEASLK